MSRMLGLDFQIWVNNKETAEKLKEAIQGFWRLHDTDISPWEGNQFWVHGYGECNKSDWVEHDEVPRMYRTIREIAGDAKATITVKYVEQTPEFAFNFGPGHEDGDYDADGEPIGGDDDQDEEEEEEE